MASQPFVAEIRMFCGNFPPRNWAFCNGQLLPIAQNTALFSLLGTTYGGNGQTNFALPDLRGRSPMNQGQGPGLSPKDLGEVAGVENVTLITNTMPSHTHPLVQNTISFPSNSNAGNADSPAGNIFAGNASQEDYTAPPGNGTLAPMTMGGNLAPTGQGQPFSDMQPFLGVSFILCMFGVFPSRN